MALPSSIIQGSIIKASDYNEVRAAIIKIFGNGEGTFGYGQNLLSQPVVAGETTIDNSHLASILTESLKIATHAGVQNSPFIQLLPDALSLEGLLIDNDHLNTFINLIPTLEANRFELGDASQYTTESFIPDISQTRTSGWGYSRNPSIKHAFTIDFGTSNRARYFFNAGGSIRFSGSRTGGSNTSQNRFWTSLLQTMGEVVFNYNNCRGTTGTSFNKGFYQLTRDDQIVYTRDGSGVYNTYRYSANDYTITASCDVRDNSMGGARYVNFTCYFNDDHFRPRLISDQVDGTLIHTVRLRRATGVNVEVLAPIARTTISLDAGGTYYVEAQ